MLQLFLEIFEHRVDAQRILLVAIAASAFRWGAGPERLISLIMVGMLAADLAYHFIFGPSLRLLTIDVGHAVIEVSALIGMLAVAVAANRTYTLWIGALQIIASIAHLARGLEQEITPLVYATMYFAPFYLQLALLAGGIYAHRRRSRIHSSYRSWRTSLLPSLASSRFAWLSA